MNKFFLTLVFILTGYIVFGSGDFEISKRPSWVKPIEYRANETVSTGGFRYLLIDLQDNVNLETKFRHYAFEVLNADGVQEMSTINVAFDPSFQELVFHGVDIIREGKRISRLNKDDFQMIQRETSLERSLYDGTLSAILNLKDIKVGDVVEYSYSIEGFNPLYQGHYSSVFYQNYTISIDRIYNRVLSSKALNYALSNDATTPEIFKNTGGYEYEWDIKNPLTLIYDTNTPSWFIAQKYVEFSSFNNWEDVANWYLPLYKYNQSRFKAKAISLLTDEEASEKSINKFIRFVQDEVRYLGFESGIGAHKPTQPEKVLDQRYGDCKDKSLLLVALLESQGVEAYPVLVNTVYGEVLDKWIPSHGAFDHCVVGYVWNDSTYYVDPTISNQGGDINKKFFPSYKRGLILREGESSLERITPSTSSSISIKELIEVKEIGGDAELTVRSEYTGSRADYIRGDFKSNSLETLEKGYLDYYSALYPEIERIGKIKFFDYERATDNNVVVEEKYLIRNFWMDSDDLSYTYAETYPLVLESLLGYSNSAGGLMPYNVGAPYKFTQDIQVILPEDWYVEEASKKIDGEGFVYSNKIWGSGRKVFVKHSYEITKEFIDGVFVTEFLRKHDQIINELSFILTYGQQIGSSSKYSWLGIVLASLSLLTAIFFSYRTYVNYDPIPWKYAEDKPIGGWLILPAIGLSLSPLFLVRSVFTENFFLSSTWNADNYSHENGEALVGLVAAEVIYNCVFLVLSVFMIVLFFQRRSSVPKIIVVYYSVAFLGPLIDHFLLELIAPELITDGERRLTYVNVAKIFIAAAIWIPYFNYSERAKSTFCKRLKPDHFYLK